MKWSGEIHFAQTQHPARITGRLGELFSSHRVTETGGPHSLLGCLGGSLSSFDTIKIDISTLFPRSLPSRLAKVIALIMATGVGVVLGGHNLHTSVHGALRTHTD